jgi:hypothetical protein
LAESINRQWAPSSTTQLEDNLKSIDLTVSPDGLTALDDVCRLTPEYPELMNRLPPDRKPGEERRLVRNA